MRSQWAIMPSAFHHCRMYTVKGARGNTKDTSTNILDEVSENKGIPSVAVENREFYLKWDLWGCPYCNCAKLLAQHVRIFSHIRSAFIPLMHLLPTPLGDVHLFAVPV